MKYETRDSVIWNEPSVDAIFESKRREMPQLSSIYYANLERGQKLTIDNN